MTKDVISGAEGTAKRYIMYAVYAIIIVVICIVILKIIQAAKAGAAVAGDVAGQAIVAAQTGISASRQIVCKNSAQRCADATTIVLRTVMWVSNDEIYAALGDLVTADEAKLCSNYYKQQTGFGLKSICSKSLLFNKDRVDANVYSGLE
jgi:hypothetical protein